jgi:hypothetical protein
MSKEIPSKLSFPTILRKQYGVARTRGCPLGKQPLSAASTVRIALAATPGTGPSDPE